MPRLLIVEDDPRIIEAIEKAVALESGFDVRAVSDPQKVLAAVIDFRPDLVLLDVKLPGGDGRQVLKLLKANTATAAVPVIFLTGMSSEGDRVLGLNLGADDYVVKPFGALELLARIRAVLRRVSPESEGGVVVTAGPLTLDPGSRLASVEGAALRLQPKEFEVLYLLVKNAGRTLARSFLIENSSSYGQDVATRSLDTHIKNLRKKLDRNAWWIQTVHKLGYRFSQEPPNQDA
ncbi:MAG: response regulator transcription factor [Elusimicrobia bacterium]|nr:response regulator transcription factor [Elusimicrobiota bacterium]